MQKIRDDKGFNTKLTLIVVIVLAVVGLAGWKLYRYSVRNQASTTTSSSETSLVASSDPYDEWKTYCDDDAKACFKYPADWTIEVSTNSSKTVSLHNTSGSVLVGYETPFTKDGGTDQFFVATLEGTVVNNAAVTVIGGIYGDSNTPELAVVDNSLLQTHPLKLGAASTFVDAPRYTNKDGKTQTQLIASPVGNFGSADKAKAWFQSADAAVTLQILKSFHFE